MVFNKFVDHKEGEDVEIFYGVDFEIFNQKNVCLEHVFFGLLEVQYCFHKN